MHSPWNSAKSLGETESRAGRHRQATQHCIAAGWRDARHKPTVVHGSAPHTCHAKKPNLTQPQATHESAAHMLPMYPILPNLLLLKPLLLLCPVDRFCTTLV
jgi:hypothetical protein